MNKQAFLGLAVVVAGVLALLANLDIGSTRSMLEDWWPLAIIGVGLFGFWSNPKQYVWPLLAVAFGGLTLLDTLDIVDVDASELFFPLLIVGVGLALFSGSRKSLAQTSGKSDEDVMAVMSGSSSRNSSEDYKGGAVTSIMGGVELDISKANIKDEATIRLSVLMGGVEIRVAENVVVKNRAQMLMGGFEDKSLPLPSKSAPVLYIDGSVIMGGVEIKR